MMSAAIPAQTMAQSSTPAAERLPNRAIAFYPESTGAGTYVSLELQPGESATFGIVLGNAGEIPQTLRTYAVPALSGVNGGFVLAPYGTAPDEQTSWMDYEETEHTFRSTEGIIIPVTVIVPEGTAPGEYVTGLAAEQRDAFDIPGTDLMMQRVRWAVPVMITVPGERNASFEVGDVVLESEDDSIVATVSIANSGNVIVRPTGEVRLLDTEGNVVGVSSVAMSSVYTGTATTLVTGWYGVPASSTYSVAIVLTTDGAAGVVEASFNDLPVTKVEPDATPSPQPLTVIASLTPLTRDSPPSMLQLTAEIANNGEPIENARVSIVTYQDGVEVDRYPVMQAVTIPQGTTPVQARYALPGGFTSGTYTFDVTIELGDMGTQTILVTHKLEFEVTVP